MPRPRPTPSPSPSSNTPKLLSGGNPQIAKADGPEAVEAYLAAMPEWKQRVGRALDDVISRALPDVRKAVRWNTPFYGWPLEGDPSRVNWVVAFHCITRYVKVSFFRGASLNPPPPESSKLKDVRYLHIHEADTIDEVQLIDWVRQAAKLESDHLF
jgi:hypothetical protein